MRVDIIIKPMKNGYVIKFYRGVFPWLFARYVAKDKAEILKLISDELEIKLLDVSREEIN